MLILDFILMGIRHGGEPFKLYKCNDMEDTVFSLLVNKLCYTP
jgi:hypothetical protein